MYQYSDIEVDNFVSPHKGLTVDELEYIIYNAENNRSQAIKVGGLVQKELNQILLNKKWTHFPIVVLLQIGHNNSREQKRYIFCGTGACTKPAFFFSRTVILTISMQCGII